MTRTYSNLTEFYRERGGLHSPESDYGSRNWNDLEGAPPPRANDHTRRNLRVSHVNETGDWYAVQSDEEGTVILLGQLEPGQKEPEVHREFKDWAEGNEGERPLSWYIERIARVRKDQQNETAAE